ncbi:MAG: PEP-CTERM sorting domain-containing protein [Pseudomonadota bacterium]|uniref:PEP-CTERM sorting domain-containing protein n=2 Tax=Pseudomonadota TaxID=1224 RepID=A0ABY6MRJ3_9BURK|nr:PEP-CTERM sorting domain-containing protein [Schlegelella aquatica]UZD54614.1 PEP-CTERM sorting domain-containing protein [Schlegelella aquatica]
MKKHLLALGLAAMTTAASAQLSVSGPDPSGFTGYNGTPATFTGTLSSGILNGLLDAGVGGTLSITFLGKDDAWHHNTLSFGELVIDNKSTTVGSSFTTNVGAGLLSFLFKDVTDGETVPNGGPSSGYATYTVVDGKAVASGNPAFGQYDFILGFNDGHIYDADYDDLVVGISLVPIPEPETYALMLAGLGAMGFMARRRQRRD